MAVVLCLIALALGYKVFIDASKEKNGVKLLGQVIGIAVMIFAILFAGCFTIKMIHGKYGYGYHQSYKGYQCPYTLKQKTELQK